MLLIAASCYGSTYLACFVNSPDTELNINDTLFQVHLPQHTFHYDEPNTGDHNHNACYVVQHFTQPDSAGFGLGCNNMYWDRGYNLNGAKFPATFDNFKRFVQGVAKYQKFTNNQMKHGSGSCPAIWQMKEGDTLVVFLGNASGWNETQDLRYFFNHDTTVYGDDNSEQCHISDGDAVHPNAIRTVLEPMQGDGHILIISMFWSAASFEGYWSNWPNCTKIYGADVGEPVYTVNNVNACGDNELLYRWCGRNDPEFIMYESMFVCAPVLLWLLQNQPPCLTNGCYPNIQQRYDDNKDGKFSLLEAYIMAFGNCHDQNSIIVRGEDIVNNNFYPEDEPLEGGGESIVIPDIYPNPFNPMTTISFELLQGGNVELSVFNILGQQVVQLCDGYRPIGSYDFKFNATDLPTGIYYVRMGFDERYQVKKMVLLK